MTLTMTNNTKVKLYIFRSEQGNFKGDERYFRERLVITILGKVSYRRIEQFVTSKYPDSKIIELAWEITK